jgi:hypothetical protein
MCADQRRRPAVSVHASTELYKESHMNKIPTITMLLTTLALASCAAPGAQDETTEVSSTSQAVDTLVIDSSLVATPPAAALPAGRLPLAAFTEGAVIAGLLHTDEAFTDIKTIGSRSIKESASWHLERDPAAGHILALRKTQGGPPVPQDEAQLQQRSTALLDGWGIHAGERGRTLQRRTMSQGEGAVGTGAPKLRRYKTFFFRGLNGVRVEGHRAVVSYAVDGSPQRLLVAWPALAASGHKLRTTLTRAQIEQRARAALAAEGETSGQVWLYWRYVPAQLPSGEAVLTLRVGARVGARPSGDITDEARIIDVDVSAT